jgi:hypothetical protein
MGTEDIAAGRNLPALHEVDQPGQGRALVDRPGRGGGRRPDGFRRRPAEPGRGQRCVAGSVRAGTSAPIRRSGARFNRLSMGPILPLPSHSRRACTGSIGTANGRPLARPAALSGAGGRRRGLPCPPR